MMRPFDFQHRISDLFAYDAWRLLGAHYEQVLTDPADLTARGAMLLGAHEAGMAIEQSMLGGTHAANPLTTRYGTTLAGQGASSFILS